MILIAIDPSITCTGVAVFNDNELIECAHIRPKDEYQKKGVRYRIPAHERINDLIKKLGSLIETIERREDSPVTVAIEITSGKVNRNRNQSGSGLGTYGMAVGQVVRWCIDQFGEDHVHQFYENDWTRGSSKIKRKTHASYTYPLYRTKWQDTDSGMDISDAIMLGDYTLQQIQLGTIGGVK